MIRSTTAAARFSRPRHAETNAGQSDFSFSAAAGGGTAKGGLLHSTSRTEP